MKVQLQTAGGVAALVASATYIVGFAVLVAVLVPSGYDPTIPDPTNNLAIVLEKQALMYAWNFTIYVLNGAALVVLVVAFHARLKDAMPSLSLVAFAFGLIWSAFIIASGMIANVGLSAVEHAQAADPERAANLYIALGAIAEGLGGGNEVTGGLWVALVSAAGILTRRIAMPLNFLGLLVGACGVLSSVPVLAEVGGAVFGLGMIVWFAAAGIIMIANARRRPDSGFVVAGTAD